MFASYVPISTFLFLYNRRNRRWLEEEITKSEAFKLDVEAGLKAEKCEFQAVVKKERQRAKASVTEKGIRTADDDGNTEDTPKSD
jgi:hypothetical protein